MSLSRIRLRWPIFALAALGIVALTWVAWNETQATHSRVPGPEGAVEVFVDDQAAGFLAPADLSSMPQDRFTEQEAGTLQQGVPLSEVVRRYLPADRLAGSTITVHSTARQKQITLAWADIAPADHHVLIVWAQNRNTLRISGAIPQLATRQQWVQDIDWIRIMAK